LYYYLPRCLAPTAPCPDGSALPCSSINVEAKTPTALRRYFRNWSNDQQVTIVFNSLLVQDMIATRRIANHSETSSPLVYRYRASPASTWLVSIGLMHPNMVGIHRVDAPCHCRIPAWTQAEVCALCRLRTSSIPSAQGNVVATECQSV
jgi:hypothetical protein